MTLVFAAWAEFSFSTSVYRYHDIFASVGKPAYFAFNFAYFGGMVLGVAVGQAVSPSAGAGVGFGIFIVGTIVSLVLAKTPQVQAPRFFARNGLLNKAYYLMFYSGNQLRQDLNAVVAQGKNWNIPVFWGPLLRFISSPTLAIVFSFGYPEFYTLRNDPVYIFGFILAHIVIAAILIAFLVPRWAKVIVPVERRHEGQKPVSVGNVLTVDNDVEDAQKIRAVAEEGDTRTPSPTSLEKKNSEKPKI